MKFFRIITALLFLTTPSYAITHRSAGSTQADAEVNIGQNDMPGAFMNFMKTWQSVSYQSGSTPAQFDINGYPITTLPGNVGGVVLMPAGFAGNSTQWIVKWPSTRPLTFTIGNGIVVTNCYTTTTCSTGTHSGGATFSGGSSCSTSDPLLGNSCRIAFTFLNYTSGNIAFYYQSGAQNYAAGSGPLLLLRASDETTYDSCILAGQPDCFTPEFLSLVSGLHPKILRFMGWSSTNNTNEVNWADRTTTSSISYQRTNFPPNDWAGGPGASGAINCTGSGSTCSSDVYTATAATNTPSTFCPSTSSPSSIIQGVINFSNATTTPTFQIGARGAHTIVGTDGNALSIGELQAGSLITLIEDCLLGEYLYAPNLDGIAYSVPVEVEAALANAVGAHMWDNIPDTANLSYITSRATAALGALNSPLLYKLEYSNECWNPSFTCYHWGYARGLALGWPNANNEPIYGWQSLRSNQMARLATTAWSSQSSRLQIVGAVQAYGSPSIYNTYLLQGHDLVGATYPNYLAFVGGTDPGYNTSPNRLIDLMGVNGSPLAYAPYWQGSAFTGGGYGGQTVYQIASLQTMLTDFAAGGSGITTALALLDADIRQGVYNLQTVTFSGSTGTISGTDSFGNNQAVTFTTTGTLPTGIVAGYPYFVINNNGGAGTFQIAATVGGSAISPSGGSGTLSVGRLDGTTTLLDYVANIYGSNNSTLLGWQNIVTANGYNVVNEVYEGGYQMSAPQASDCTTMGITAPPIGGGSPTAAGCAAQASALLAAYLNSSYGFAMLQSQFNQLRGKDATQVNFGLLPTTGVPGQLSLSGPNQWSMCSSTVPTPVCYQTYNAFATYH